MLTNKSRRKIMLCKMYYVSNKSSNNSCCRWNYMRPFCSLVMCSFMSETAPHYLWPDLQVLISSFQTLWRPPFQFSKIIETSFSLKGVNTSRETGVGERIKGPYQVINAHSDAVYSMVSTDTFCISGTTGLIAVSYSIFAGSDRKVGVLVFLFTISDLRLYL